MLKKAGIKITPEEKGRIEVADFGLNELEKTGLEIITYVNTERVCAKEIMMFPHQTCPEHLHPPVERPVGQGRDVPLPLGHGLSLCPWARDQISRGPPARRLRSALQSEARSSSSTRRSIHADARNMALVPGGARGRDGFRVLHPQHRRSGCLHRSAHRARSRSCRGINSRAVPHSKSEGSARPRS